MVTLEITAASVVLGLVIGAGPVGVLIAMVARSEGAVEVMGFAALDPSKGEVAAAIALIASGAIDRERMIPDVCDLSEVVSAFAARDAGGQPMKSLIGIAAGRAREPFRRRPSRFSRADKARNEGAKPRRWRVPDRDGRGGRFAPQQGRPRTEVGRSAPAALSRFGISTGRGRGDRPGVQARMALGTLLRLRMRATVVAPQSAAIGRSA